MDHDFIIRAGGAIKEAIGPVLDDVGLREPERAAPSGDTSFRLDLVAEEALDDFLKSEGVPLALFTEDRGMVHYGQGEPEVLLVVDPIDGTRPALAGLECACISLAMARYRPEPRMRDVFMGCLLEIKGPQVFVGERGKGVVISSPQGSKRPSPSETTDVNRMFWSFELVGRPAVETMAILEPLAEASGPEAGLFLLSSATFSISRIILGHLDAYVDIGARVLKDMPELEDKFLRAGAGRLICLFPYDIAAAVLLAQEAGCCVTDAYGRSLDDLPLIRYQQSQLPSCLVASNHRLHQHILAAIDERFAEIRGSSAARDGGVD